MKPLGPLMASPTSSAALGRIAPDASSPSAAVSVICAPALCSGEEGALARMLPAFKLGLGGPIGSGKQWMSWIHIDDMVAIILHCINNPAIQGAVNATAPHPVINR